VAIPPAKLNKSTTAADLEPAPTLFTALQLNFNLPPALKKNLAASGLANATLAPKLLVTVAEVSATIQAGYAVNELWLATTAELVANNNLS
jgi:hypothetical protein